MSQSDELQGRVYVHELKNYFHFRQITGNEESLNRWIIAPDINRPGMELSGFTIQNDLKRVVLMGNKEITYLNAMSEEKKNICFDIITDPYTPCIIFSRNNEIPQNLINIANQKNFPIFQTEEKTYRVLIDVVSFLERKLAKSETLHGVMLSIFGIGVLLTGQSGIGKSELALELISRGHSLISDDRVDIIRAHNDLVCFAPDVIKGMLEIRGIGIVDVALMYGAASVLDYGSLDLVISLQAFDENKEYNRLGARNMKFEKFGLEKPLLEIPIRAGRAMSVIVEAAVKNQRLREKGIDSGWELRQRVLEDIQKKAGQQ